jgi:hypothetical protein
MEQRLQLARRAGNDTQHLRRRCLLLQRLAQLSEKARVLDGDDGLRGEIRHQFDLPVGEPPNLPARHADGAD